MSVLTIEVYASDVEGILKKAHRVATNLDVMVTFQYHGVLFRVTSDSNIEALMEQYRSAWEKKND